MSAEKKEISLKNESSPGYYSRQRRELSSRIGSFGARVTSAGMYKKSDQKVRNRRSGEKASRRIHNSVILSCSDVSSHEIAIRREYHQFATEILHMRFHRLSPFFLLCMKFELEQSWGKSLRGEEAASLVHLRKRGLGTRLRCAWLQGRRRGQRDKRHEGQDDRLQWAEVHVSWPFRAGQNPKSRWESVSR